MFSYADMGYGYWWAFPVLLMVLCVFLMWGRRGSLMCMPGGRKKDERSDSGGAALEILNKRYAQGEIDKQEYEEKKRTISA